MVDERIKTQLKYHHMSGAELAERMGVSKKIINQWTHKVSNPDLHYIEEMAKIFNCSREYLLGD